MRKHKTIKIDDREITVKELRVKDIRHLIDLAGRGLTGDNADQVLEMSINMKMADLDDMAPSEIKTIWDAVREVNADFLAGLDAVGLKDRLRRLIDTHLTSAFAASSNGAM